MLPQLLVLLSSECVSFFARGTVDIQSVYAGPRWSIGIFGILELLCSPLDGHESVLYVLCASVQAQPPCAWIYGRRMSSILILV